MRLRATLSQIFLEVHILDLGRVPCCSVVLSSALTTVLLIVLLSLDQLVRWLLKALYSLS